MTGGVMTAAFPPLILSALILSAVLLAGLALRFTSRRRADSRARETARASAWEKWQEFDRARHARAEPTMLLMRRDLAAVSVRRTSIP